MTIDGSTVVPMQSGGGGSARATRKDMFGQPSSSKVIKFRCKLPHGAPFV